MRTSKLLLVFTAFFLTLQTHAASLGDSLSLSPFWDWKTITTEHFRITFPDKYAPQAQKVAQYYEEAHRVLSDEFYWEPDHQVQVVLVDHTDAANGMASPVSRFGMLLYLTTPETYFSTTYYEDWLKLLVFHEYTHYLNMDTTRDFYKILRYVFGDVLLPNSLWPSWMLEGLAVYMETKYSNAGRGRSPYFDMVTRTAVEANKLKGTDYISLDQINGERAKHPGGEAAYLFGYEMMNEAATAGPDSLGRLSYESASRLPFFINGNLENVTGRDWYKTWDDWVVKTEKKSKADLDKIRKHPVTKYKVIDANAFESMGGALDPSERYLAFSSDQQDHWQALYVRDLKTGDQKEIEDKFLGLNLAFHPTQPALFYSSLERNAQYNFYSDLKVYHVDSGKSYFLSRQLRAKDPDVSRDGKTILYSFSKNSGQNLAIADLVFDGDEFSIKNERTIFDAGMFNRASQPRFTADGKGVIFSYKKNGSLGEDLLLLNLEKKSMQVLVSNRANNRYAAVSPSGELFFVSDLTGVDNLYSYANGKITPRSNFTTGVWAPFIGKTKVYGSVFELDGWKLAEIDAKPTAVETIAAHPAPESVATTSTPTNYPVGEYSAWPTLAPRQWAPILLWDQNTAIVGGQVFGYDAVMRHQYFAYGSYDTELKRGDYAAQYANRNLGATLTLDSSLITKNSSRYLNTAGVETVDYTRKSSHEVSLSFPFRWTIATLEPRIAAGIEREEYERFLETGTTLYRGKSTLVPTQEATLSFSNARSSRWAVAPERGRRITLGAKRYDDHQIETYKGIFKATEYFELGGHWVLSPSIKGVTVSKRNNRFGDANAILEGRKTSVFNPIGADDFDQFYIRGYPITALSTTRAATGSMDLRFPLSQIFRGLGTNPLFFDQLSMNVFGETTFLPRARSELNWLPAAGAGLRLSTEVLLRLPLTFGVDYHRGFNEDALGKGEFFFSINFGNILPVDI